MMEGGYICPLFIMESGGRHLKKLLPLILIAISAGLWGTIVIFVRVLSAVGFTSMEIVTIRVLAAFLALGMIGVIWFRPYVTIRKNDIGLFVGTGILSIIFFNWCYFTAFNMMSVSLAVILLYTAPAFVTVLSFFFLKEGINLKKVLAVVGTILGCILIAGANISSTSTVTFSGILIGLGAGFGYALYTIFGKFALKKYHPFTVTFYTFLVATVSLVPFTRIWEKGDLLLREDVLLYALGLGLFPTVIAYLLYTKGLEKTEGSKASIIATAEPVVATLLGIFLYSENLKVFQILGSFLILLSAIMVNLPSRKQKKNINDLVKNQKASI
jgi:drug/metabolite transporter, DME family